MNRGASCMGGWQLFVRVRIVKERLRNTKPRFADRVICIACGLHNLRMEMRHPASQTPGCATA